MKSTGIVRRVDELGRVVIPIEIRNKFGIAEKDPIEIYVEGSNIVLKNLSEYKGKLICDKCSEQISKNLEKEN